jgi:hypothetical protein
VKTRRPTAKEEAAIAANGLPIDTVFFPDEGQQFGSLNKPAISSRYIIGDTDFDDLVNWVIFPQFLQQPFGPTLVASLPSTTAVWAAFLPLNGASFIYALGANGHLYQISITGTITDIFTASTFTQSGTLSTSSNIITGLTSTTNMIVGGGVSGTGIQSGTVITQINSSTSITVNKTPTVNSAETLTFTPPLISTSSDIESWQGTEILFSDLNNNSVYQWNGSIMTAVFQNQPALYLAVFGGRLWFTNGGSVIQFTAAGTYNSLSGDAGNFTITENDCPGPIVGLKASQGLLYAVGYSWAQVIGNLSETTIGTQATLNFTRNTAINNVGTISKWSMIAFDYSMLWAVSTGLWSYYGSAAMWMSEMVGGFFQNLVQANTSFSAGFGIIQQLPCLLWNICWNNPNGSATEYTILALDTTGLSNGVFRWMRFIPQTTLGVAINISFITSGIDQVNKVQKVWGFDTSGNLYQLFSNAAASVTSQANGKLWNFGTRIRVKSIQRLGMLVTTSSNASYSVTTEDENLASYTPDLSSLPPTNLVSWEYSNGVTATFKYSGGAAVTWFKNQPIYAILEADMPLECKNFGINFSLTGINSYLYSFGVELSEIPADWGG